MLNRCVQPRQFLIHWPSRGAWKAVTAVPDRLFAKMAEAPMPQPVRSDGAPEIYCDVAVAEIGAEVVHVHLCRRANGDPNACEVVGTVILPFSGWLQSHAWARLLANRSNQGH